MRHAAAIVLLVSCLALHAQKARPIPIPLKDGHGVAQGHLKGRQEMDYEIQVTAPGQTVSLSLTATPLRTLTLRAYDDDSGEIAIQKAGPGRWTIRPPKPGPYGVTVVRTGGPSTTRFTLTVTVH